MFRLTTLTAALGTLLTAAVPAAAAPLTTAEILNQFNLVTFGDVAGTSHVDGRTLVGGNLTSQWMVFNMKATPASAYADLIVGGNVLGNGVHANSGADVVVGGVVNSGTHLNLNGGGTLLQNQGAAAVPGFEATLKASSAELAQRTGTGPTVNGNKAVFNAAPIDGLAVYNIDLSFFDLINEIELALNGADTVVINVAGDSATLQDNFIGGSYAAAPNVLWNFFEATDLVFDRQFVGSVLAPYADVTVTNNNIEGALVAQSAYIGGEIHLRPFTGTIDTPPVAVPAPAALPLMLAGLAGLVMVTRRRKA